MYTHNPDAADQTLTRAEAATISQELANLWSQVGDQSQGIFATLKDRVAALEAQLGTYGQFGFTALRIVPNAAAPNSQLDVSANRLAVQGFLAASVAYTVDLAASGKNGRDTGSEAANTWYYVFAVANPTTGEVAGLFSTNATTPTLTHTSLNGFTLFRRIGAARNNNSSNLIEFIQQDAVVLYTADQYRLYAGSAAPGTTGYNDLALTPPATSNVPGLPPTARAAYLNAILSTTTATRGLRLRPKGATGAGVIPIWQKPSAITELRVPLWIATDVDQKIQWQQVDGTPSGVNEAGVYIDLLGYVDTL